MAGIAGYRRSQGDTQPSYLYPPYVSTQKRSPTRPLVLLPHTLAEVTGRGLGERGRTVPPTLIEPWQANSAGRSLHTVDRHDAPGDPHFTGCGRTITGGEGRYRFVTIRPGAYPWRTHHNAGRPAPIPFPLFGPAFLTRLVTQMYFPGDPRLPDAPTFNSLPDGMARNRLIAAFDWEPTIPERALGYRFAIVLRGRDATPTEQSDESDPDGFSHRRAVFPHRPRPAHRRQAGRSRRQRRARHDRRSRA